MKYLLAILAAVTLLLTGASMGLLLFIAWSLMPTALAIFYTLIIIALTGVVVDVVWNRWKAL